MSETPVPSESRHVLVCVSGPDSGKRLAIGEARATLGRAVACNLVCDDADIADEHLAITLRNGQPHFEVIGSSQVFVDGRAAGSGVLRPGHQVRLGRSYWQVTDADAGDDSLSVWVDKLSGQISAVAGVEKIRGFSPAETFSEVFKRHSDDDIEEYFMVGSPRTTPPLSAVSHARPRPWVFVRAMVLSLIVYAGFYFAFTRFDYNIILLPGLIMAGSFAIPVSMLIFYFEVNTPRNVSLYALFKTVLLGGILSLALSLFLFKMTKLHEAVGAPAAGLIEEIGKAAALLLVIYKLRYRWILNGMLLGAAVGTGFAAFESAGYALNEGLVMTDYGMAISFDAMVQTINFRAALTLLGGHVIWSALVGGALWRVRGDRPFRFEMVKDIRFWRVLLLAMAMHAIWNAPWIPNWLYIKYIVLGFVAWVATIAYIQAGLRQVQAEKANLAAAPLSGTVTTTPPAGAAPAVVVAAAPAVDHRVDSPV